MKIEIKFDKMIGHETKGLVGRMYKSKGDKVKNGEALFEIEAKKGNVEISSSTDGVIVELRVSEGDEVSKGQVLAIIEGKKKEQKNAGFDYFNSMVKPKEVSMESEITIIGGGPGGYVAAIVAAKLGANVVIVEKEKMGGTCLNWGCIPTKAFVHSAYVYQNCKEAEKYGISVSDVNVDISKIVKRKNNIVRELVGGIDYLLKNNNVKVINGTATIQDKETVYVENKHQKTIIKSKNIIIATGSKTSNINIKGNDLENVITSKEILDIDKLPKKMIIVGGGIIGMEFAFLLANLDVDVTVIEYMDCILTCLDDDVCKEITQMSIDAGIKLHTSSKVESIINSEDGKCIVSFTKDEKIRYVIGDKVLMSVGRQPCFDALGVEKIGIKLNDNKKGIKVNEYMETNIDNIYAIGDVTNIMQLAHVASHQGVVAVKNILGKKTKMSYDVVPSAIFTTPEIGMVGITEKQAREKNIDIKIGKFPFSANGKALTLGEKKGFVKLIKENKTGKIIGGTIIGPHSTDLIAEVALAIKNNLTSDEIIETIHAHPTTAESIHEASLALEGGAIHFVN